MIRCMFYWSCTLIPNFHLTGYNTKPWNLSHKTLYFIQLWTRTYKPSNPRGFSCRLSRQWARYSRYPVSAFQMRIINIHEILCRKNRQLIIRALWQYDTVVQMITNLKCSWTVNPWYYRILIHDITTYVLTTVILHCWHIISHSLMTILNILDPGSRPILSSWSSKIFKNVMWPRPWCIYCQVRTVPFCCQMESTNNQSAGAII